MKWLAPLLFTFFVYGQHPNQTFPNYLKADSIAHAHHGASLQNLPVLAHVLTADLSTDFEKFRAIYTWVSTNIKNDYASFLRTKKHRKKLKKDPDAFAEWNAKYVPKVIENIVSKRKAACTGYAYLVQELAKLADIECVIVNGYGRTMNTFFKANSIPNHSWNAVKLNNNWYLCDATWSAGMIHFKKDAPYFKFDYNDGFFLTDPELFIKNHYPLDIEWTLLKTPLSFDAFIDLPVIYNDAFKIKALPLHPAKMHFSVVAGQPITFTTTYPNKIKKEDIRLIFQRKDFKKRVTPKISKNGNNLLLECNYLNTGSYDVHLQMNNMIVATYVVSISKR